MVHPSKVGGVRSVRVSATIPIVPRPLRLSLVVLGLALVVGSTVWTVVRVAGPTAHRADPTAQGSDHSADALDWGVLAAYDYKPGLLDMPETVKSLDGKRVTMRGFLEPLYEFEDIHEFVLKPRPVIGSGGGPTFLIGEGVQVTLPKAPPGISLDLARLLRVEGILRVVETKEQGYILSIYRIDDARVNIER